MLSPERLQSLLDATPRCPGAYVLFARRVANALCCELADLRSPRTDHHLAAKHFVRYAVGRAFPDLPAKTLDAMLGPKKIAIVVGHQDDGPPEVLPVDTDAVFKSIPRGSARPLDTFASLYLDAAGVDRGDVTLYKATPPIRHLLMAMAKAARERFPAATPVQIANAVGVSRPTVIKATGVPQSQWGMRHAA